MILPAIILAVGLAAKPAPAPRPPSAQAFYSAALGAMSDLPQPEYVSYTLEGTSHGMSVDLVSIHHLVWLTMGTGTHPNRWRMLHRTRDYESDIVDENNHRWVSQRAFFDPTWYGAYRALREGMLDYQRVEKPMQARVAAVPATLNLPTIAIVNVIGLGMYAVHDRGAAVCPNGDPGHALHLVSRDHNPKHQLDDVIVDLKSMRFCMIRFGVPSGFGFSGTLEQDYAEVGGYWMQIGGMLDGTMRAFGISFHSGSWTYRLAHMTFPKSLSAAPFIPPATQ